MPQYTTRSDAAYVMLMWRKNGHPEKKEGGFQLAITEVLMFYIVSIYYIIYICMQALNEILKVNLNIQKLIVAHWAFVFQNWPYFLTFEGDFN